MIKGFDSFKADLMFTPSWALESWMRFVEKVAETTTNEKEGGEEQFRVQIVYEGADISIKIFCLDPSIAFKQFVSHHKPRSIILTSGTLSPLKAWPL